jgi:hypothetical protein
MTRPRFPHTGRARGAMTVLVAVLIGAAAVSWAWNRLAADLAGLPEAHYVHGLAALSAAAAIAAVAALAARAVGPKTST